MHIIDALNKISKKKPVLFTTPGHCQENIALPEFNILKDAFKYDYSEVDGLDNLQNPENIILKSQEWASSVYGSGRSFYLVNGSSSGILALMLATVKAGDKVLIARNAHKSVINALVLTGAMPVWINADWIEEWNIPAGVDIKNIKEIINKDSAIKAVWLTNPTYEGVVTDISSVAAFCREIGIPLIVDEAHGALWNFSDNLPDTAIKQGADASVQSLHKTASGLNQAAILHLSENSKINPAKVQQCLNIVNTTSPSYLILASIEGTIEYLDSNNGRKKLESLIENCSCFRKKLSVIDEISFLEEVNKFSLDRTKLFFGIKDVSGYTLGDFLLEKFNIEVELDGYKGVLALTGIGTDISKLKKLEKAVISSLGSLEKTALKEVSSSFIKPDTVYTPRDAFSKKSAKVDIKSSVGKVSKETIVLYPPGIPILISGELIQQQHIDLIKNRDEIEIIVE